MAHIRFHYDEKPPCLALRVETDKDAETIISLVEFQDAFKLLVSHTSVDIPLDDIESAVREVLNDQPI